MAKLVSGVLVVCLMALPWTHAGDEGVDKERSRPNRRHSGLDKEQWPPNPQSCPTTDLQQRGCRNSSMTNTSGVLDPKTFNGKLPKSTEDDDSTLPPSLLGGDHHLPKDRASSTPTPTPPWLEVDPGNPAVGYVAGVLSTCLIPAAYVLAMALGIPSNLYILLFLRSRTSRSSRTKNLSSSTVLYLSLALSDLLLLCSLGLRVHYHLNHNDWVFGEAACRLATASFYWNVSCSAHTIACISVSRYLAVARPFLYRRLPKTALAAGSCLAVWLLFGASVVPELLVRQSYHIPRLGGITTCHDVLPLRDSPQHAMLVPYRLALVCVGVTLPFVACVLSQGAMVYHLSTTAGGRRHWAPFVRVSSLVFLIFLLCFAPAAALHAAHYARLAVAGDHRLYRYYRGVVCLCCVHACLDPLLCLLMSKTIASKLTFKSLRRKSQMQAAVV